jgi:hypothetical protein
VWRGPGDQDSSDEE